MQAGDGGNLGHWSADADGLPVFVLDSGPDTAWHQVGNHAITATAHAGGCTTIYATRWGWIRLSDPDPDAGPARGGTWRLTDARGRVIMSESPRPTWGIGYAEWTQETEIGPVRRRVSAPPGEAAVLRVDVTLPLGEAGETDPPPITYEETWGFRAWPIVLGGLMSRRIPPPAGYGLVEQIGWESTFAVATASRALTDLVRRLMSHRFALTADPHTAHGAVLLRTESELPSKPTPLARLPEVVFVAPLDPSGVSLSVRTRGPVTSVRLETCRPELSFVVGLARAPSEIPELTAAAERSTPRPAPIQVTGVPPAVRREAVWHAGMLDTAQTRDGLLDCRFVPQGSAYSFVHGVQGAPRDYALTTVPLAFVDPAGARDMLRLVFRMQRADGAVEYAHTGCGFVTGAVIHSAPSDLPIWLLWALTEYVWATQNFAFLDEQVPVTGGTPRAVRAGALAAWRHLREGVGVGPHGLLRVGSGDWNDPIAAMAHDRRAFHRHGESVFNSAFAAYVLPRAARLVADRDPADASEMEELGAALHAAVAATWTGDWFLRGYDGRGGPLGAEHLFLDSAVWCLIAGIGEDGQRRRLVEQIRGRCDDPSPIGATILDRPHPVRGAILQPGWDCNGGVWAAICGLLVWAYALHDAGLALAQWEKSSLAGHARAYPDVWYGIWSGPDSYNSWMGERAGETFVQPATPMTEFPVMNSNAHAGPLLGLLRLLGVETEPSGVVVRARPAGIPGTVETALGRFGG